MGVYTEQEKDLTSYNSIIIGAGHNGLVCAAYLAKKGQKVLLLEAGESLGGLAANREFHPEFNVNVAHSINHFSNKVIKDLKLISHGLIEQSNLATIGLSTDQNNVVIQDGVLSGTDSEEVDKFNRYKKFMQKYAKALSPFWLKTIPRIGPGSIKDVLTFAKLGLNIRTMGKQDMLEFLRVFSLPVRDLMDENFDNEILKAMLSWDGLIGSKMAPRSPNSTVLGMLYRQSESNKCSYSLPSNGVSGLIESLRKSAEAYGVEIRTATPVEKISIETNSDGIHAVGVQLTGGEQIKSDNVISATDPKRTFFDLLGVEYLDIGFTNRINRLRCDGFVGKLHLALDDLPNFKGIEKPDGRMIIASDMDAIEFAFDNSKYGECSDKPVMEIVIPSLRDTSLAPKGQHVLSAHVMYVPYQLKGGWTDDARDKICQKSIDTIAEYAPNIRDRIVHAEFLTPLDLEQEYRVTGGHWHHTEFAMDQMLMMRPTYDAAQYNTPIPGLYLCGAGSHPGGDLVGASGHNAAKEILR